MRRALPLLLLAAAGAHAQEVPTAPSTSGQTGLISMPDARVAPDGTWRTGLSYLKPYQAIWSSLTIMPFLEGSFRYTRIMYVPGFPGVPGEDYGDFKDKEFDFKLRVPQATIRIRGTDFMVAIVNPAVISVGTGAVGASNAGGTVVFGAGSFGSVASSSTLAVAIPGSAVPPAAAAAFSSMGAVPGVVAGGMAPGAAAGGTVAGMSTGTAVAVGAVVAAGVIAAGNEDSSTTVTHNP